MGQFRVSPAGASPALGNLRSRRGTFPASVALSHNLPGGGVTSGLSTFEAKTLFPKARIGTTKPTDSGKYVCAPCTTFRRLTRRMNCCEPSTSRSTRPSCARLGQPPDGRGGRGKPEEPGAPVHLRLRPAVRAKSITFHTHNGLKKLSLLFS